MEDSLLESVLNEDNYEDYIEKIINIFRLSSKESSILLSLIIKDYKCSIKLSIVGQNGEKREFNDATLKCDEAFYKNFLDVLVQKFVSNNEVITKDIVNLDGDALVTLRFINCNNDLFSIDGLSDDHAKYLLSLCEDKEEQDTHYLDISTSNNNIGAGNIWIFVLMIVVLVLAFILIVFLVK